MRGIVVTYDATARAGIVATADGRKFQFQNSYLTRKSKASIIGLGLLSLVLVVLSAFMLIVKPGLDILALLGTVMFGSMAFYWLALYFAKRGDVRD